MGNWSAFRRLITLPEFETAEIEAAFWKDRDKRLFVFRRWMFLAGIVAFAVFFVVEIVLVTNDLPLVLAIRFGATALVLLLWILFCGDRTPGMREALIAMAGIVTVIANLLIIDIAGPPLADVLPFALPMIMAVGVGLLAPRFRTSIWTGLAIYALYWISVPFSESSFAAIAANAHFMSLSLFAALVGTFLREKIEREQSITNRHLASLHEQAYEAGLVKDRLLASVSHELRTPINAIAGFSEIMKKGLFGTIEPQRYRDYVGDIYFSARLLKAGIDDLLEVSRIEMHQIDWDETVTPFSQIVGASVSMCEGNARKAGIALSPVPSHLTTAIRTDHQRLTQALANIIDNAIKFSEHGSTVRVDADSTGDGGFVIRVQDSGRGIPPDHLERVREPFAQVHFDHHRSHEGGLGLGLSIARGFIEKMDGRLTIDSQMDIGTTVSIHIPPHRISRSSKGPPTRIKNRAADKGRSESA